MNPGSERIAASVPPADAAGGPPVILGRELLVPVACPRCQTKGSVPWDHLGHGFRCPKCRIWFQIERDGQSVLCREGHPLSCPRCRHRGTLVLTGGHADCPGCGLPLFLGPNGRLYTAQDLAAIEEKVRAAAEASRRVERTRNSRTGGRRHAPIYAAGALAIIVILVGGVAAFSRLGSLPSRQAADLTRQCLEGEWEAAEQRVGDDDQQLAEFRRWQIVNFASIQSKFRPEHDRVSILVAEVQSTDDQRIFLVTMTSQIIGERKHVQYWSREEDAWLLDATSSLHDPQKWGVRRQPRAD